MAKEINKQIRIWLNQKGIEDNLKSVRSAITKTTNELAKLFLGCEKTGWLKLEVTKEFVGYNYEALAYFDGE